MEEAFLSDLEQLLLGQYLGVLATDLGPYPYTSLVGYSVTKDLRHIHFATMRSTRKYSNLQRHPKASLLIDSRTHHPDDFFKAAAVSALGVAEECPASEMESVKAAHLLRHPQIRQFVEADTCAMMRLCVEKYVLVRRFQEVVEWSP